MLSIASLLVNLMVFHQGSPSTYLNYSAQPGLETCRSLHCHWAVAIFGNAVETAGEWLKFSHSSPGIACLLRRLVYFAPVRGYLDIFGLCR